jgi:hypothetical protein
MGRISLSRPRYPSLLCRLAADPLPCTGGGRGWELWGVAWCGFQVGFGRLRSTAWWMDGCKGLDALGYPHSSYSVYHPLPVLSLLQLLWQPHYHSGLFCLLLPLCAVLGCVIMWFADCSALLWMFLALSLHLSGIWMCGANEIKLRDEMQKRWVFLLRSLCFHAIGKWCLVFSLCESNEHAQLVRQLASNYQFCIQVWHFFSWLYVFTNVAVALARAIHYHISNLSVLSFLPFLPSCSLELLRARSGSAGWQVILALRCAAILVNQHFFCWVEQLEMLYVPRKIISRLSMFYWIFLSVSVVFLCSTRLRCSRCNGYRSRLCIQLLIC